MWWPEPRSAGEILRRSALPAEARCALNGGDRCVIVLCGCLHKRLQTPCRQTAHSVMLTLYCVSYVYIYNIYVVYPMYLLASTF